MLPKSALYGINIDAMNSPLTKPETPSSRSPLAVTLPEQLRMIQEWEDLPGQGIWGTAHLILEVLEEPMTQESFLSLEGLGGRDLDECLEDLEQLVEDEILPPWFDRLPRE